MPPRSELVVIEDSLLQGLSANPIYVAEFPFLAPLARTVDAAAPPQKTCCGRRAAAAKTGVTAVYAAAKSAIAGMPVAKKVRLKEILNTRQLRVFFHSAGGKLVKYTF
jgi:hypothetical protein